MYVAYEEQCGNCVNYDYQGDNEKGYCSYYMTYYYPGETCMHQEPRQKSSDSGCFITTIVCDLLGYKDDCDVLNTLRSFRDNVMQKNSEYKKMLFEYDFVGPEIAKNLKEEFEESEDKELVNAMYNFYILPTVELLKEDKQSEAVDKYVKMTNALRDYYGIKSVGEVPCCYDYTNGGHGVKKLGTCSNK